MPRLKNKREFCPKILTNTAMSNILSFICSYTALCPDLSLTSSSFPCGDIWIPCSTTPKVQRCQHLSPQKISANGGHLRVSVSCFFLFHLFHNLGTLDIWEKNPVALYFEATGLDFFLRPYLFSHSLQQWAKIAFSFWDVVLEIQAPKIQKCLL